MYPPNRLRRHPKWLLAPARDRLASRSQRAKAERGVGTYAAFLLVALIPRVGTAHAHRPTPPKTVSESTVSIAQIEVQVQDQAGEQRGAETAARKERVECGKDRVIQEIEDRGPRRARSRARAAVRIGGPLYAPSLHHIQGLPSGFLGRGGSISQGELGLPRRPHMGEPYGGGNALRTFRSAYRAETKHRKS